MHITLVTSAFQHPERADTPGVRRYTTELVRSLVQRGHEARVVLPGRRNAHEIREPNIEVASLPTLRNLLGPFANLGQAALLNFGSQFLKFLDSHRDTDIVHSTIPLLTVDSVRNRFPVVMFGHHTEILRRIRDLLTVPFGNAYGSYTYRRADAVVVPSQATASELVRRFGVESSRVSVISHGINTDVFFQKPARSGEDGANGATRKILFVGPLTARKNVLLLVKAFDDLLGSIPQAELALVGRGPLESQIDREARSALVDGRLVRYDRLSDEDLRGLYSSADIFVTPSLQEGFGFAAVEAMACGTPVIALNSLVNREVLGDAGILVQDATVAGLSQAMARTLRNKELMETLARRGLARVKALYSWRAAAAKYEQLYEQIIDGRRAI